MSKFLVTLCIFALMISSQSIAARTSSVFPKGCKPDTVTYYHDYVILNHVPNERPFRVYVFRNVSSSPVTLEHPQGQQISDVRMVTTVKPGLMTAVLAQDNNFIVTCKDGSVGYQSNIPCQNAVNVCELAVSPVMSSAQGQYWITENQGSTRSLFGNIRAEGIYP